MKTVVSRNSRSFVALAILLLVAIGVFAVEISAGELSPLLSRFFSAIEFFLAAAIGWILQAIVAREENIKSLRQYAISAYRRITDIGMSVSRIKRLVYSHLQTSLGQSADSLEAISAVADEMTNTVRSSTLDWADIIGEDLEKVDRIRQLRERLEDTAAPVGAKQEIHAPQDVTSIRTEIDRLRSDLPFLLQQASAMQEDPLPREGRYSMAVASHLRAMIDAHGAISIPIQFFADRDGPGGKVEPPLPPLRFMIDQNMFSLHLTLIDDNGTLLGEVENPLHDAGVYRNDFIQTLLGFLPSPAPVFPNGLPAIVVPNARIARSASNPARYSLEIPVHADSGTPVIGEPGAPVPSDQAAG